MKLGTPAKLFLLVLTACAMVLAVNGVVGRYLFERGFLGYLNEQGETRMREVLPQVEAAYDREGSWDFVRNHNEVWFELMRPTWVPVAGNLRAPPVSDQTGAVPRFALLDLQGRFLAGNPQATLDAIKLPIAARDGHPVGWFVMIPFEKAIAAGDVRFSRDQSRGRWVNGITSVLIAALLAWLLSRTLLRQVGGLTGAIHRLAAGDFSARAARTGDDELGRLGHDINRLADTLEDTERNRRSYMADISHELRTPLTVMRAQLEAIQDGIRPMTPETLATLQRQVQQLGKLIDDLHDLALTQAGALAYRSTPLDLDAVLQLALDGMRGRLADAGLQLRAIPAAQPCPVNGDERRLQQLFANLLENSLRYTDAGGQVVVAVQRQGDTVRAIIEDSAPGVDEDKRGRLFERFYRAEESRNRASGGSGLGLAICRNIAQAHGGTLHAEASALGGLRVVLTLPVRA